MALVEDLALYEGSGATGDVYYRNASGKLVPVGGVRANGNVITDQTGGVPLWATPTGGTAAPAWVTNDPDTPPTSPTTFGGTVYDLEFVRDASTGSGTDLGGGTAPSIVDRALRVVSGTSASTDVKGREWACPGSAFTMTAKVRRKIAAGTFGAFGPMLRRNSSGAGNFIASYSVVSTLHTVMNLEVDKYTTLTARSSSAGTGNYASLLNLPYYIQLQYDGTNITGRVSFSGHADTFAPLFTETAATFLGGAPGRFGIIIDNFGTAANAGYCEWIRFT